MDEEVDLQDGHIQLYEHWRVHVMMQYALLPDQTDGSEVDLCTQEHGGAAYMDGCSFTFLEELIHVTLGPWWCQNYFVAEMNSSKYALLARPVSHNSQKEQSRPS